MFIQRNAMRALQMIGAERDGCASKLDREKAQRHGFTPPKFRLIGLMSDGPLGVRSHHRHLFSLRPYFYLSMLARIDLVPSCFAAPSRL